MMIKWILQFRLNSMPVFYHTNIDDIYTHIPFTKTRYLQIVVVLWWECFTNGRATEFSFYLFFHCSLVHNIYKRLIQPNKPKKKEWMKSVKREREKKWIKKNRFSFSQSFFLTYIHQIFSHPNTCACSDIWIKLNPS